MNQPGLQLSAISPTEVPLGVSSAEVTKTSRQASSTSLSLIETALSTIHDPPVATVQTLLPLTQAGAYEESAAQMLKQVNKTSDNSVVTLGSCPPSIVRLINFANSVLTHGLVCSNRDRAYRYNRLALSIKILVHPMK